MMYRYIAFAPTGYLSSQTVAKSWFR
jgi:hypothetical protein